MKALIAFRSKYGTTARCAGLLSERIKAEVVLADLSKERRPSLATADVVLIGGSIYGGRIQREVTALCDRERPALLAKKVALFICCLFTGEKAEAELESAFPDWLLAHAFSRACLGGELHPDRLSLFDKMLAGGLGARGEVSALRMQEVDALAAAVNGLLAAR